MYPEQSLLLAGREPVSSWLLQLGLVDEVIETDGLSGDAPGKRLGRHIAVNLHGRGPESHRFLQEGDPDELVAFTCAAAHHRGPCGWYLEEHEVDRWCRLVSAAGGPCGVEDLRLDVGPVERDGVVLVHPGAASGARRWPVDRWAEVVRVMAGDGHQVVLTGSEVELCEQVSPGSWSGPLSLDELARRIAAAALLISGDTGVAHLATAVGTPSVTLFGPTPPAWWGPAIDLDRHSVLYYGTHVGDPHADQPDEALLRISVSEVLAAARRQLAGTTRPSS